MNALNRRFVSNDEAVPMLTQHRKPCGDCPFARTALRGWLGLSKNSNELATADEWIDIAHAEGIEICHCIRLLELVPEWKERLQVVAEAYPDSKWPEIIKAWGTLIAADPRLQTQILSDIHKTGAWGFKDGEEYPK